MWDADPGLHRALPVLRFDTRGHGQSLVTPGPYSIEQLGRDVLALLDALASSARISAACPWAA
jgi:3-oxoadipate enol-lactonase